MIVLKMEETDLSRGCHTTERVENVTMMSKLSYLTQ